MAVERTYFQVEKGFCEEQAVRMLQRKFGGVGVAAYFRLMCALVAQQGGRLRVVDEAEWEDLAGVLYLDSGEECMSVVQLLRDYGALDYEGGILTSRVVSESLAARDRALEQRREAGRASGEARRRKKSGSTERS